MHAFLISFWASFSWRGNQASNLPSRNFVLTLSDSEYLCSLTRVQPEHISRCPACHMYHTVDYVVSSSYCPHMCHRRLWLADTLAIHCSAPFVIVYTCTFAFSSLKSMLRYNYMGIVRRPSS
ncbi:hypothetical protein BX600DRAFT_257237 [Xylariales sp. PMI_506]|nr:hypothetical protein BX600DRAFT_257237 [Xylariales sp. PMI_506]